VVLPSAFFHASLKKGIHNGQNAIGSKMFFLFGAKWLGQIVIGREIGVLFAGPKITLAPFTVGANAAQKAQGSAWLSSSLNRPTAQINSAYTKPSQGHQQARTLRSHTTHQQDHGLEHRRV
jgi:hypothetical protein